MLVLTPLVCGTQHYIWELRTGKYNKIIFSENALILLSISTHFGFEFVSSYVHSFFEKMRFEADEKVSCRIEESIILCHDSSTRMILLGDNHSGESTFFPAFFLEKTAFDFLVFFLIPI